MLSIEGMEPLGNEPALIDVFCTLGVRMASLTWNRRNAFADGDGRGPRGGLSRDRPRARRPHGRAPDRVRSRARQRGHVLRGARAHAAIGPCSSVTRSAAPSVDIPRNLSDDQLRALAERDGVVGLMALPFVMHESERTISYLIDHVDHLAQTIGIAPHLPRRRLRAADRAVRRRRRPRRRRGMAIDGLARPGGVSGACSRRCAIAATARPTCAPSQARTCCACCAARCPRRPDDACS